jgi:hypothetical protein
MLMDKIKKKNRSRKELKTKQLAIKIIRIKFDVKIK